MKRTYSPINVVTLALCLLGWALVAGVVAGVVVLVEWLS